MPEGQQKSWLEMILEGLRRLPGGGREQPPPPPEDERPPPKYGVLNVDPGQEDIRTALQGDWQAATQTAAGNWAVQRRGIEQLETSSAGLGQQARDMIQAAMRGGLAEVERFRGEHGGLREAAMRQMRGLMAGGFQDVNAAERGALRGLEGATRYSQAQLGGLLNMLGGERARLDTLGARAWDERDAALAGFRSTVAQQMGDWNIGFMEQQRASKEQTARTLAAQGFSPTEIDAELRKMDRQAGLVAAQQVARFGMQEEAVFRDLQRSYTDMALRTNETVANIRGQLAGIEAESRRWAGDTALKSAAAQADVRQRAVDQRTTLRTLQTEFERWNVDADRQAQQIALDVSSRLRLGEAQFNVAANMMELQGRQSAAQLWASAGEAVIPFSPLVTAMLGIQMMLEDRHHGAEGSGMELVLGALNAMQGMDAGLWGKARGM